jgi:D-glycero-alpha-D-manno-heptose 1-phosphate guanylyltransferase
MEAIILAGGLGTRLRSIVPDLPKAMAPVGGRPFLACVLDSMAASRFERVILAVGFRSEQIRTHFGDRYGTLPLQYSIEETPLGTGGAIRLALRHASTSPVFVLNGDTYVDLDYAAMWTCHRQEAAQLSIAVHAVPDAGRYGALDIDGGHILGFLEKRRHGPGLINAGVYLLERELLAKHEFPSAFSFESDFLVPNVKALRPLAFRTQGTFIDIGVPEDYARAQRLLVPLSPPRDDPAARP